MPNMRAKLSVSLFTLFCTVGLLGGCNKADPTASGTDSTPSASAGDQDQQATLKYNAYVDAANYVGSSFEDALDSYKGGVVPYLKKKGPLQYYSVNADGEINATLEALQKAFAQAGTKTDIDPAAQAFAQALQALAPISHELNTYADAKAYLADHGEKARAKHDAYLAALEKAAKTEAVFTEAVKRYDIARTQAQFQKAKKGSPEYYRLGIVIHARNSMNEMKQLYAHPQDEGKRKAVEAEFNQIQSLLDEYSAQPQNKKCRNTTDSITGFLAQGRTVLEDMRSGEYAKEYQRAHDSSFSDMEMDSFTRKYVTNSMEKFNSMINSLNQDFYRDRDFC